MRLNGGISVGGVIRPSTAKVIETHYQRFHYHPNIFQWVNFVPCTRPKHIRVEGSATTSVQFTVERENNNSISFLDIILFWVDTCNHLNLGRFSAALFYN